MSAETLQRSENGPVQLMMSTAGRWEEVCPGKLRTGSSTPTGHSTYYFGIPGDCLKAADLKGWRRKSILASLTESGINRADISEIRTVLDGHLCLFG